jgi:type II secretory pathway pseudopilin PulG
MDPNSPEAADPGNVQPPVPTQTYSPPIPVAPPTEGMGTGKSIVTVLFLVFFTPVGLVLMWAWTRWPKWLKWLITFIFVGLFVLAVLSLLLAVVLVSINPARQFARANNTKRHNDVVQILNTVQRYAVDNNGSLPLALRGLTIGTTYEVASGPGHADICSALVPTYTSTLPVDPNQQTEPVSDCSSYDTGYQIAVDANNRVTVSAPHTETTAEPGGEVIKATR